MARWRVNPIFAYECARTARRWQTYAGRTAFLAVLFGSLIGVWVANFPDWTQELTRNELTSIGERFFFAIAGTQLTLVLLAAPAYTAGAICIDKARGILDYLLITGLSSTEIILGKLGARLLPVLGLILAGLPVLALAMLLGGIDPLAMAGSFMVSISVALVSCALALALSVWGKKTHEVMLVTYLFWIMVLLALPVWIWLENDWRFSPPPAWVERSNPFWLSFAPYLRPQSVTLTDYAIFLLVSVAITAMLTFLATLSLRRVGVRSAASSKSVTRRWLRWPTIWPSLDFNPVLWREWHRRQPSRWLRVVWGIYAVLSLGATTLVLLRSPGFSLSDMAAFVNAFQFGIGLLMVSIVSASSLFEERVRGSLDVLLTTPLATSTIVAGKWLGGLRAVVLIALLPSVLMFYLSLPDHWLFAVSAILLMLVYGAAVISLGLALATWVPRYGLAVGMSVLVYVLMSVGPLVLVNVARQINNEGIWLCLSPWFSVGAATDLIARHQLETGMITGIGVSLYIYIMANLILIAAILRTFDACLGRVRQTSPE